MKSLKYIFCAVFVQMTKAQVISYVPQNGVPGQAVASNQPQQPSNCNPMQAVPNGVGRAPNVPNGIPYGANTPITDNGPTAAANQDAGAITNADPVNANGLINSNLAALTNLASLNGNMATFNMGDGGFTVTSGSPGSPGFGIQVLADALEVGGTVAVNGQIPIYGAVALNGYLPTDGSASVNYGCGRSAPINTS